MQDETKVTPWKVEGEVDYKKLVREYGTSEIDDELLAKFRESSSELHFMLTRKIYYSHRDLDWILDKYQSGEPFALYTGRGPSGQTTLGHLLPWVFTKWLQDRFDAELYFQITDDEKYLLRPDLDLDDTKNFAYSNLLDVIATGFDDRKTHIFIDTEYMQTIYPLAVKVAKHITCSTAMATFGFTENSNAGIMFFPAVQIVPCFLPSEIRGHNVPVLIPAAIDQDPYWRLARDVAPKLGYYKPAQIHAKLLPGIDGRSKMSTSEPNAAIFVTDSPESIRKKIERVFLTHRREQPAKDQPRDPSSCTICKLNYYLLEPDDRKLKEMLDKEAAGQMPLAQHTNDLCDKIAKFVSIHQGRRERAKDHVDKFLSRD